MQVIGFFLCGAAGFLATNANGDKANFIAIGAVSLGEIGMAIVLLS